MEGRQIKQYHISVDTSVDSQENIKTTMEGRQDKQCNINIPGKKIINTNHNNVVETLTSSMETAQAKFEELVESKAESVSREADIIPGGRKEKARSWVKLKSGLYGWKKNSASSSKSKHRNISSNNGTQTSKANRSTLKTDQTKIENTHNRLADISPGAAAIGQDNSQSQASIRNYYFSNFESNNVWVGQTRKSVGDILKASGVKGDQDQDQL